jgi:replicative DNA helicase
VVLAQLNRLPDQRTDHRPRLSDLRESGSVEQDADMVWFLYRPAYYDENADKTDAELIVAKNRQGPTGAVRLVWNRQQFTFADRCESVVEDEGWS